MTDHHIMAISSLILIIITITAFIVSIFYCTSKGKSFTVSYFIWSTAVLSAIFGGLFNHFNSLPFNQAEISNDESTFQHSNIGSKLIDQIGVDDFCQSMDVADDKKEMFFLETSGEDCLTARQACSVESASRANPDANIVVRMESISPITVLPEQPKWIQGSAGLERSCKITGRLLKSHKNVRIVKEDLMAYLKGTPLERFINKVNGMNQLAHKSDLIRVALLWRSGGFYLDLDVVVLRPLYCLKNTLGLKNWKFALNRVENSVLTFEAGHPFLHYFMQCQSEEYKEDDYFSLGPPTLSSALLDYCETDELPEPNVGGILKCLNDSEIEFQPTSAFFALDNEGRNVFFNNTVELEYVEKLKKSYLSHIYEAKNGIPAPPESLYGRLAQSYCPITYELAMKEFGQF